VASRFNLQVVPTFPFWEFFWRLEARSWRLDRRPGEWGSRELCAFGGIVQRGKIRTLCKHRGGCPFVPQSNPSKLRAGSTLQNRAGLRGRPELHIVRHWQLRVRHDGCHATGEVSRRRAVGQFEFRLLVSRSRKFKLTRRSPGCVLCGAGSFGSAWCVCHPPDCASQDNHADA
jgi:hypothetical protein